MTAAPTVDTPAPAAPAVVRRKRRWLRVAIPFAVLFVLVAGTIVLHSMNEPDRGDPAFLAPSPPAAAEPIAGGLLAQRLRARGVQVERMTRTSDALNLAYRGGFTLFVPSPSLMHRDYLRMLWSMPGNTRVVLVEPSGSDLARGAAPIATAGRRWATAAVAPTADGRPCAIPGLESARTAAVLHSAYAFDEDKLLGEHSCYENAVVQFHWTVAEIVAVGSADPFRDDRIDEYDNSALAVGLLATHSTLIWLDVHDSEPGPLVDPNAVPGEGLPPSLAPGAEGSGDGGYPTDGDGGSGDGGGRPSGGSPGADPGGGEAGGPSFFDAFPPSLWPTLVGLLLLGALLALWRGRRLGPPVAEPLPFSVKGAETVLGRARLYQRAGAMLTSAQTMRRIVGPQIAQELGLPPTATAPQLAAAIAERHGGEPAEYLNLLSDDLPKKDGDLVALAGNLDALLAMVSTPLTNDPAGSTHQGETRG